LAFAKLDDGHVTVDVFAFDRTLERDARN